MIISLIDNWIIRKPIWGHDILYVAKHELTRGQNFVMVSEVGWSICNGRKYLVDTNEDRWANSASSMTQWFRNQDHNLRPAFNTKSMQPVAIN